MTYEQPTKRAKVIAKEIERIHADKLSDSTPFKPDTTLITDIQAYLRKYSGEVTDLLTRALVELQR